MELEAPVAADAVSDEDNGFTELIFVGGISKSAKMASIVNIEYDFLAYFAIWIIIKIQGIFTYAQIFQCDNYRVLFDKISLKF